MCIDFKLVLSVLLPFFLLDCHDRGAQKADFIIFSYDRPLQLYALLESTACFVTGLEDIHVIYRSSDYAFEQGYDLVKQQFPYVQYHKQSEDPRADFKPLTLQALERCTTDYIMFGVDDIVVKDYVDIIEAIEAMQEHKAYGCYLRLSPSIDYLYSWRRPQQVPKLTKVQQGYLWQFSQASTIADWGYPHTVDMTIYRKHDIESDLKRINAYNPNSLESQWGSQVDKARKKSGFCCETSKIVNLPLNLVQTSHKGNQHMSNQELTPRSLLKTFLEGKKMDIWPLFQIQNRSCHMEYNPTFIPR